MTSEVGAAMDNGPILRRIEAVEEHRKGLLTQIEGLKRAVTLDEGRISELWDWAEGRKDMYGMFVAPGRTRAEFRLPVFGSKEKAMEAVDNFRKPEAIGGETKEKARELRAAKARDIGQSVIDEVAPMGETNGLDA